MTGRWQQIRLALYSALSSITIQAIAILALSPADYGGFSLWYLGFAWFSSLCLSIICEPWARARREGASDDTWHGFSGALVTLTAVTLAIGAVAIFATGPTWASAALAVAMSLSTYRVGARYHALALGMARFVGPSDLLGAVVTLGAWLVTRLYLSDYEAVSLAWLSGVVAAVVTSRLPRLGHGSSPVSWLRRHGRAIRPLLIDSTMLDASTIGVPFILAPLLGPHGFGLYRSILSTTVPVRLLLNPIRPLLVNRTLAQYLGGRLVVLIGAAGVVCGVGVAGVIWAIVRLDLAPGSVLSELGPYVVPIAIVVGCNLPGHLYYLVARLHARARFLLTYRVAALTSGVVLPISGFLIGGIDGCVWALACHSVILLVLEFALLKAEAARPARTNMKESNR